MKFSKAWERPDGTKPPVDIAIPTFGYQNHVAIDRGFGFIRNWMATDAAAYEGARLREGLLDKTNTAASVWADTDYRPAANEAFMAKNGFVSCIHVGQTLRLCITVLFVPENSCIFFCCNHLSA